MLTPIGVSIHNNIEVGLGISGDNIMAKDAEMAYLFKYGPMDYQWTYSKKVNDKGDKVYDKLFIDFGNFNYGIVANAAGYSVKGAFHAAALANLLGEGSKAGYHHSNPQNDFFIFEGYNAYILKQVQ